MTRLCIIVEGATEYEFVKEVLADYLWKKQVQAVPTIIKSPRSRQDKASPTDTTHKGGNVTVERIVRHAENVLNSFDWVTTLVDFYGFKNRPSSDCNTLEEIILQQLQARAGHPCRHFIPYVQLHEFERLLFSDVTALSRMIPDCTDRQRQLLMDVCRDYANPEQINDGPQTAPSKRLQSILSVQAYDKVSMGPIIAAEVTVETMRQKCPRFDRWLARLSQLGDAKSS